MNAAESEESRPTRISLLACLSRIAALPADTAVLGAWLTSGGWTRDESSPRFPWLDPDGVDSWPLRDAVRAHAQTVTARKLRKRGWECGCYGPGAGDSPGWATSPQFRKQLTLAHALRCEGLDVVQHVLQHRQHGV